MNSEKMLSALLEVAEELGIKVIQDKGNFKGGYCILKNKDIIVLNRLNPIEQKVKSLAQAFSKLDVSGIYIKPAIRDIIESYVVKVNLK
tara:strand:- start:726 stop:992 length:267 start_codon:yes stop_codon:yes gene_type:complete